MNNYTKKLISNLDGRKIIIAGCNGYIGSELTDQLDKNNINYIGIDKTKPKNNNCYQFNLVDEKSIEDIILNENPDYFFHMGTHSALAYKNNLLESFNEDNSALYNILVNLKKTKKTKLVYFSSSYVYSGHKSKIPANENTPLFPKHNFGMAKLFFENLISREYDNNIIFRLCSVYGEGNYLHPNVIRIMSEEAINNKKITVWGKGKRSMQYIYIEDVVKNVLSVSNLSSGIYNLCNNNYLSVKETAKIIAKFFDVNIETLEDKTEGETLPFMDNQKLTDSLNKDQFSNHIKTLNNYLKNLK